jgi:GT2 family glycosyltransferase
MNNFNSKKGFISILICSRNRRDQLEKLAVHLKEMDTSWPYEIVIVEETNFPKPIEGVKYIPHPIANRGIPFARNLAIDNAVGEIIVFLDDDCQVTEGWLNKLLDQFKNKSTVGVQGGNTVPPETSAIGWGESILGFPGGGIRRVYQANNEIQRTNEISTLNCAYRKWVLEKVGRFDIRLIFGSEDFALAKQVAKYGNCFFIPSALVIHEARGSLRKIWKWFFRRGKADIGAFKAEIYNKLTFSSILKSSMLVKFLILVITCFIFPKFSLALLFFASVSYWCIQYKRFYGTWRKSQAPYASLILVPIIKLTMDIAMDCGRVRGTIFG